MPLLADCATLPEVRMKVGSHDRTKLLEELFPDGNVPADIDDLRFVFVCRAVLGVFLQVGEDRSCQLNSTEPVFSAGRVRKRQIESQRSHTS